MKRTLGLAAVVGALAAAGSSSAALVQPGSILNPAASLPYVLQGDASCTANFMFSGSDGDRYVGTAGHCYFGGGSGDEVFKRGKGRAVYGAGGQRIGEFAHAVVGADDPHGDYALIRLDPPVLASPRLCFTGGPTALDDGKPRGAPFAVHLVGAGLVVNTVSPARLGLVTALTDPAYGDLSAAGADGDSGAPVMDMQGVALGNMIGIGPDANGAMAGIIQFPRLSARIPHAERRLGIRLTLLTAPLGGNDSQCPADQGTAGSPPPQASPAPKSESAAPSRRARLRCNTRKSSSSGRRRFVVCRVQAAGSGSHVVLRRGEPPKTVATAKVRRGTARLAVPRSIRGRLRALLLSRSGRVLARAIVRV